jgi:hypothetical protein
MTNPFHPLARLHGFATNVTPTRLRPGLPPVPRRMQTLPLNDKGYPVPYFVEWIDGKPDFRVIDRAKFARALKGACWLCGEPVGKYKTFVLGTMCTVTRTSSEPPCHLDCATFAAMACPFMILPRSKRRMANLPADKVEPAGFHIDRNPGAMALWTTTSFKPFNAREAGGRPGILIEVGEPISVEWYALGAVCGREPVLDSIESGFHHLWDMAKAESRDAMVELENQYARMQQWLPAA